MTLWSEFTADFRSCVKGPGNIQYSMSVCLENLPGLTQRAGKHAYSDALRSQVLIQATELLLVLLC